MMIDVRNAAAAVALAAVAAGCAPHHEPEPEVATDTVTSLRITRNDADRTPADVRATIYRDIGSIRARCGDVPREINRYETTLHLEIAASGSVDIARAHGNHPLLDACVADVARGWHFEEGPGRTFVDVPFVMKRRGSR